MPFNLLPGDVLPTNAGKVLITDTESATVVRLNADGSFDRVSKTSWEKHGELPGLLLDVR